MPNEQVVLAIAFKSKRCGIAVFSGERLIYYDLCGLVLKGKSLLRTFAEIIKKLIAMYRPQFLVLEETIYRQREISSITRLHQKINKIAKSGGVEVILPSPKIARRYFCGGDKPTNENAARRMIAPYPELKKFSVGQSRWQAHYTDLLFRAVTIGLYSVQNPAEIQKN